MCVIFIPLHAARRAMAAACHCLETVADYILSQTEMVSPSRAPLSSHPYHPLDKGKVKWVK